MIFISGLRFASNEYPQHMANSVDFDEMARNEPSHLDLHWLQRYLYWSAGMKGKIKISICLTLLLLNMTCPVLANSVDPAN